MARDVRECLLHYPIEDDFCPFGEEVIDISDCARDLEIVDRCEIPDQATKCRPDANVFQNGRAQLT